MLKKLLMSTITIMALGQTVSATDDYHLYGEWNIGGYTSIYDIAGFIDTNGRLGNPKAEYVIFNNAQTGYIYRVDVTGDPNMHPDNPDSTGPVATRTFTFISQSAPGALSSWGSVDEFYVDDTGIYFGSGKGIKRWDFDWGNESDVTAYGLYSETLARNTKGNSNPSDDEWWTATGDRKVYKYNNSTNSWEYQFNYPSLAGSHHDGMEIVNNTLYLSDMTSDKIIKYDINATTGIVDNPLDQNISSYSASPAVEGMGFGPNKHFWMSARTAYEVGGTGEDGTGTVVPPCSQTFHFNQKWEMQTAQCDDINVPGFDDTLMVGMSNGILHWVTADAGTIAWLNQQGITAESSMTLKLGNGFWTYGKIDGINKLVGNGKLQDNYLSLKNGVYTFVGFNLATDLNTKFGTQPVEEIYYYNGSWNTWKPIDGNQTVPTNQGLYVLPNGDFNILLK